MRGTSASGRASRSRPSRRCCGACSPTRPACAAGSAPATCTARPGSCGRYGSLPDLLDGWAGGTAEVARDAAGALGGALTEHLLRDAGAGGDLADGCAGALAVLAAVPEARAAVRRVAAGLAAATVTGDGLAHGRAGVALALWRAAGALGDAGPLRAAALRLLNTDRATGWTWCRGRAGVHLAAASIGPAFAAASVGAAAGSAVAAVPAPPPGAPHHLCCGLIGHASTAAAAERLPAVERLLDRLAADRTPRYLLPLPAGLHQPGLFQGAAGLALGLLALTRPGLPDPLRITAGGP